jgi:hypothetical protein
LNQSISFCQPCEPGRFINEIRSSSCRECDFPMDSEREGAIACTVCEEGYYGDPPSTECRKCPINSAALQCPKASSVPFINQGYCRVQVAEFLKCIPEEACLETAFKENTPCKQGYSGNCCSACSSGYFRRNGGCVECPSKIYQALAILVALLIFFFVLIRLFLSKSRVSADVRITLQLVQLLALYPNITEKWPQALFQLFQVFSVSNLNVELFSPECSLNITYWGTFYLKMSLPLFLIICFFLGVSIEHWITRRRVGELEGSRNRIKRIWSFAAFLLIALTTFNFSSALGPFVCISRDDGTHSIAKYPSQRCYDQEWKQNVAPALLFLFGFSVIFPVSLMFMFFLNRKKVSSDEFVVRYGLLIQPYRNEYYYWEFIVVIKRCIIVMLNDFFLQDKSYSVKYMSTIGVLLFFVFLDVFCRPYLYGTNLLSIT